MPVVRFVLWLFRCVIGEFIACVILAALTGVIPHIATIDLDILPGVTDEHAANTDKLLALVAGAGEMNTLGPAISEQHGFPF